MHNLDDRRGVKIPGLSQFAVLLAWKTGAAAVPCLASQKDLLFPPEARRGILPLLLLAAGRARRALRGCAEHGDHLRDGHGTSAPALPAGAGTEWLISAESRARRGNSPWSPARPSPHPKIHPAVLLGAQRFFGKESAAASQAKNNSSPESPPSS